MTNEITKLDKVDKKDMINIWSDDQYGKYSKNAIATMKAMADIADERPSNLLLSLGSFLILMAIFLRSVSFVEANFGFPEYITLVVVGTLQIICGVALRVYQYRTNSLLIQMIREDLTEFQRDAQRDLENKENNQDNL